MERRESIKSMIAGGLAGGLLLSGCNPAENVAPKTEDSQSGDYGRTEDEKIRDEEIRKGKFFNEHEIETIAILCDLILPATATAGSATDAGVPDFIEFIVKDIESHQTPMRGGIMWMDHRARRLFDKDFNGLTEQQQKLILDEVAYTESAKDEVRQGVSFFSHMRNLVLTGYYTTRMGIDDLGYKGNSPNTWDGVPSQVLEKHGLEYDTEWLSKCVNQDKRDVQAEWDKDGNLIS